MSEKSGLSDYKYRESLHTLLMIFYSLENSVVMLFKLRIEKNEKCEFNTFILHSVILENSLCTRQSTVSEWCQIKGRYSENMPSCPDSWRETLSLTENIMFW